MKELQTVQIGSLLRFETTKYPTALASTPSRGRIRSFSASSESKRNEDQLSMAEMRNGTVAPSGSSKLLRTCFVTKGHLSGTQDSRFRAINDDAPIFGFSIPLSVGSPRAVFTIGHVRDPYVNYVTPHGQLVLRGLWTTRFPHFNDARVPGNNYAVIAELSTLQVFATFELTTGVTQGCKEDLGGMRRFKELSSNDHRRDLPALPGSPLRQPKLLALLLEPLLVYTHSSLYSNRWPVHDLGTYPNATGYATGNDEPMPVEEAGNMLWMALSGLPSTSTDDGLVPAEQLSTDDFAGTLSNQTGLAIKAMVGIGVVAKLAKQTRRWTDWVHYRAVAKVYDKDSWGLLYNLSGDRMLALDLFPRQLYEWQSMWYHLKQKKYGLPHDPRHPWTKTDWQVLAVASATDKQTRDMFIDSLFKYFLHETPTANWPGQGGLDWPIHVIARPVVGAHFALLAPEKANGANGVLDNPFRGKDEGNGLVDHSAGRNVAG
ncbi:hypothetical protein JCM21900_003045 [Sporobolomyces salmonicolor]